MGEMNRDNYIKVEAERKYSMMLGVYSDKLASGEYGCAFISLSELYFNSIGVEKRKVLEDCNFPLNDQTFLVIEEELKKQAGWANRFAKRCPDLYKELSSDLWGEEFDEFLIFLIPVELSLKMFEEVYSMAPSVDLVEARSFLDKFHQNECFQTSYKENFSKHLFPHCQIVVDSLIWPEG